MYHKHTVFEKRPLGRGSSSVSEMTETSVLDMLSLRYLKDTKAEIARN